jgi:hypothetical protein
MTFLELRALELSKLFGGAVLYKYLDTVEACFLELFSEKENWNLIQ